MLDFLEGMGVHVEPTAADIAIMTHAYDALNRLCKARFYGCLWYAHSAIQQHKQQQTFVH